MHIAVRQMCVTSWIGGVETFVILIMFGLFELGLETEVWVWETVELYLRFTPDLEQQDQIS